MSPSAHARLSASGSHRWIHCPPSVALEDFFPDTGSSYAAEGVFAHALAELYLTQALTPQPSKVWKNSLDMLRSDSWYTEAMHDHISEYATKVMERVNTVRERCIDAAVMLEERLDFSHLVPEGFGTGDVIIVADGEMEVIDLKYGAGVPVSAENNSQLRLYGLGAINNYGFLYDINRVTMTIIQPRLDNVSSETLEVSELVEWGERIVRPAAELAIKGEGEYDAGDHCRFCKARFTCRERAEFNLQLAKYEFRKADLLDDKEMAEVLGKLESFTSWLNDVGSYALDQAENHNKKWPGWKLVEGRSNRKYADEDKVATALLGLGAADAVIYERKLLGITAMEKAIGKKLFAQLPQGLIIKPPGKPALVPESDKRPEINSIAAAQAAFKEDI